MKCLEKSVLENLNKSDDSSECINKTKVSHSFDQKYYKVLW